MQELIDIFRRYNELTKDKILNFEKFNLYAIVHNSNSIEGSTLTLEETMLLLDEHLTPSSKPLNDTYMALDHYEALKYILGKAKEKQPLSEEIIKNTSSLIMKNTGGPISSMAGDFDSSEGEYRKLTVRAGNRTFIDYKKVPDYTKKLINYINDSIKITDDFLKVNSLSYEVHFQMLGIHPFADGNGRLSRLLMNYIQSYHGLPPTIIYQEDKAKYYKSLEDARNKEEKKYFLEFMFNQTKKYLQGQIKLIEKVPKEKKNKKGFSFLY